MAAGLGARRVLPLIVGGVLIWGLFGCDYFAQRELKPGVSTSEDVARLLGKPEITWEEPDGSRILEFVRGPAGHETYRVLISPDRRFLSMRNILVPEEFAKVKAGMSEDEVRRLLGKPTEIVPLKLKQEIVWSWRHTGDQQRSQMFNVHFGPDKTVRSTSISNDPLTVNAG